jgi:hypothetical protein
MKNKTFLSVSLLLLFGASIASCDSCNKKNDVPDSTATSYSETDSTLVSADTITTDNAGNDATQSAGSNRSNKARSGSDTKTNGSSVGGYSAPDGTDAENHDGDQYTKNDESPKPTGPPIK